MSYTLSLTEEVTDSFRTCIKTIHRMERAGEIQAITGLCRVERYRRESALSLLEDRDE